MRFVLLAFLQFIVVSTLLLVASMAYAHEALNSYVYIDVGEDSVELEVHLSVSELELAKPELFEESDGEVKHLLDSQLRTYFDAHLALLVGDESVPLKLLNYESLDMHDVPFLKVELIGDRMGVGREPNYSIVSNLILHRVKSHKMVVILRSDFRAGVLKDESNVLRVLSYRNEKLNVHRAGNSDWKGFLSMMHHGASHIAHGIDHLLFLFCLLLTAPLVVINKRWYKGASFKSSVINTIKVVTAFTVGHSVTLGLCVLGYIQVASAPVEILVAVSILIAAALAVRPLMGELGVIVAILFGLIHGLAFANELIGSGLGSQQVALSLLAFNVGIELSQILIILMVIPCLWLMSRTKLYGVFRGVCATAASIAAITWILERAWDQTTLMTTVLSSIESQPIILYGVVVLSTVLLLAVSKIRDR